ncbi:4515_t:CDS:2 [Gigaspora rosea]|nr:4515_t:CDS:2 [Gigaspora rosea]
MKSAISVAKNPSDEVASHKLESFRIQLKEELEKMSENWDFYEKLYETEEIDMAAMNRSVKNGTVP